MDNPTLNTISLCSGVGMLDVGLHAGLEYLGIRSRTILFAEREDYPVSVLVARMEEGSIPPAPIWFGDFTELPAKRFRGMVDIVVAGFPCQDLSVAGKRVGLGGARSGLFFEVVRIASDCGARFLFLENVAGIASATAAVVDEASTSDYAAKPSGDGFSDVGIEDGMLLERAAARVVGELADLGWDSEWITLSASDVGASHGRARWFCFAWRMDDTARNVRHGQHRQGGGGRGVCQAGDELGNAGLQHGDVQQRGARAEHSGDGVNVGDAECARWAQAGSGFQVNAGREPEQGCGAVADAPSARLSGRQDAGPGASDAGARPRSIEFERGCATLADASGARLQKPNRGGGNHESLQQTIGAEFAGIYRALPLFAPGPSDPRWAGIIERHPEVSPALEPTFRSVVNGLAFDMGDSRAARLKCVGNGVVPAQAGIAFVILFRRAGLLGVRE